MTPTQRNRLDLLSAQAIYRYAILRERATPAPSSEALMATNVDIAEALDRFEAMQRRNTQKMFDIWKQLWDQQQGEGPGYDHGLGGYPDA